MGYQYCPCCRGCCDSCLMVSSCSCGVGRGAPVEVDGDDLSSRRRCSNGPGSLIFARDSAEGESVLGRLKGDADADAEEEDEDGRRWAAVLRNLLRVREDADEDAEDADEEKRASAAAASGGGMCLGEEAGVVYEDGGEDGAGDEDERNR